MPSIPVIGLVLVLSVEWFIGMAHAVGNLVGNVVVAAALEGDHDLTRARAVLANSGVDFDGVRERGDGVTQGV